MGWRRYERAGLEEERGVRGWGRRKRGAVRGWGWRREGV